MANTYYFINGNIWHPEVGSVTLEGFYVGTERRMASGQLRRAVVAQKRRYGPLRSEVVSEARRAALLASLTYAASFMLRPEDGVDRPVVLTAVSTEVARVEPDVDGAEAGTGAVYYVITASFEDV